MLDVCTMRLLSERGKVSRKSGILFVLPAYRGKSCLFASFLGTYIRGAFNSRKDCPRRIVTSLFLSRFIGEPSPRVKGDRNRIHMFLLATQGGIEKEEEGESRVTCRDFGRFDGCGKCFSSR